MNTVTTAIGEILRLNQPAPVERFRVDRFKQVGRNRWDWVPVGHYDAVSKHEARQKAHKAIGPVVCIVRAVAVGETVRSARATNAGVL